MTGEVGAGVVVGVGGAGGGDDKEQNYHLKPFI